MCSGEMRASILQIRPTQGYPEAMKKDDEALYTGGALLRASANGFTGEKTAAVDGEVLYRFCNVMR